MAGTQQIALRQDLVEILQPVKKTEDFSEDSPVSESPRRAGASDALSRQEIAEINARATREAIKRYPGIGVANSMENKLFVGKVNELKAADATGYFDSPDWPLRLAETLALHEGWKRQDSHVIDDDPAEDERPAPGPTAKVPAMPKELPEDQKIPLSREEASDEKDASEPGARASGIAEDKAAGADGTSRRRSPAAVEH